MMLCIEHISYRIDGSVIIDDLTVGAGVGEVIGLVGPNGAGKSTLANLITGFTTPSSGVIYFDGHLLNQITPDQIARLGVGRTFQSPHLPWNLTVLDCILATVIASPKQPQGEAQVSTVFDTADDYQSRAAQVLARVGLAAAAQNPVRDLSFGQQRLLGLAMALERSPRLLILDEPFTGLKSVAVETVVQLIGEEAEKRAVIIIDHALSVVRELASSLWFMNKGRVAIFKDFDAMAASEEFQSNYLGARPASARSEAFNSISHDQIKPPALPSSSERDEPVLAIRGLAAGYENKAVIKEVDLRVYPGDIVSVVGLNGAGKSTLLRAIVGLARCFEGDVILNGKKFVNPTPDRMAREGIRLLVQDHRLFRSLTLRDNLVVSGYAIVSEKNSIPLSFTVGKELKRSVDAAIQELHLGNGDLQYRTAATFSGGEQARIALAQLQLGRPKLVLLDEPTSGMDGVALELLRVALETWKVQNIPVIMVEHALDFVTSVASRVILVSNGRAHEIKLEPQVPDNLAKELSKQLETRNLRGEQ
jgi:branched-chain amino acid transport system ATP-binding protein